MIVLASSFTHLVALSSIQTKSKYQNKGFLGAIDWRQSRRVRTSWNGQN